MGEESLEDWRDDNSLSSLVMLDCLGFSTGFGLTELSERNEITNPKIYFI